ncbi:MAG: IS30 family transposase [Paraglaciecola psychrophila]
MIGKGDNSALVTIVERVTTFTVLAQVNSKSAADITSATKNLPGPFKVTVRTITADNGTEFSYYENVNKALSTNG